MPPIREVKTLLNLSINGLSLIVRQEALRVSNVVEEKFIYQQIPGTDDFDFEEEDQINSDREIFLSDQVQAIKVNMHRNELPQPVKLNLNKKLNPKQKTIQAFNIDA